MKLKQKTKWYLVAALALGGALITWANNGPVSASDQQVQATDLVGKQAQQKVDLFTGSFTYSIPINSSPSRNASQPNLNLGYSSAGDDGWCGVGWNLEIGSIERNVRDGFPIQYPTGSLVLPLNQYDDTKGFMLDLFGKAYKIFSVATNAPNVEYRAETDTDFLRCFFNTNNDSWTVYDKSGTAYYFGETTGARVSNPKTGWSSGASGTFHWALDQIVTATGDWTTIGYTNSTSPFTGLAESSLYPTQINYNGHTNNGNGYSANFSPPNTISFQTEIRTNDWHFSFRSGFRTEQDRRLTNILCQVGGQNVWSYRLQYGISPATYRSLLTNVIVYGYSGSTATPYLTNSFAYQANPNAVSFGPLITWTNMILSSPSGANPEITQVNQTGGGTFNYSVADLVDIDGDGLPDRVMVDSSSSPNRYLVQKNLGLQSNGSGTFGGQYYFGPISTGSASQSDLNPFPDGSGYAELNTPNGRIRDLDGDGLPDRVMDYWAPFVNSSVPYTNFTIAFNKGTNFSSPTRWAVYSGVPYSSDPDGIYLSYAAVDATSTWTSGGGSPVYIGVGLWDINGDLWPDRVMSGFVPYGGMTNLYVEYNTGSSFSSQLREYPYRSQNMTTYPGILNSAESSFAAFDTPDSHFIDLNGDGLPDHLMWPASSTGVGGEAGHPVSAWAVEYNDGYSFESTNNNLSTVPGAADLWSGVVAQAPTGGFNYNGNPYYTDSMIESPFTGLWDVNGDGLPDRVVVDTTSYTTATPRWFVYLNNGHGFNTTPITVTNISNEGHYLSTDVPWWSPEAYYSGSQITGLIDINGDGLLDRVLAVYYSSSPTANYLLVQLNTSPFPDLLTNVNNGIGGNTAVTYAPSTAYDNRIDPTSPISSSRMPFPRQVVSSVSENDGVNAPQVTTYSYAAGYYDGPRREFHGFGIVTNTDPTLRTTVTYFHTGGGRNNAALGEYQDTNAATGLGNFAKSGMTYRTENYGNDGKLYHVQINQVDQTSLGNARYFPFATLRFDFDYPGNGTPRATAIDYAYDNTTGNLTNKVEFGLVTNINPSSVGSFTFTDVDTTDTRANKTTYSVIANNSYIVDHPAAEDLTDANNNIIQETKYSYYGTSGSLASKLTRITSGYYSTNSYGNYNTYGLITLETNSVGVVTETAYESTYNTFPNSARLRANPSSDTGGDFTTTTTYDARSGDIIASTDPAGVTISNSFDAFCRPIETDKIPVGGGSAVWMKKYDYPAVLRPIVGGLATNYTDLVVNDGVGGFTNRTYIDGFGRTIQTRIQGENSNYRVISTAYDGRGNAFLTTWPSFGSGIAFTKPTASQMANWTGYDGYGRVATNRPVTITVNGNGAVTSVANSAGDSPQSPLGAKTWTYANGTDPWWIIYTDEDGKTRQYQLDAFGRTNQIVELDGSSSHTSTLKYDLADNLTNIVNANAENIFWAFNDSGDVVAMADPYLGQWTYVRDYAGRLRVQTDARGDVVSNSYINPTTGYQDVLGRVQVQTVFSFNPTNSTLVPSYTNTYVYDSSDDGNYTVYKGLLYKTVDSQGSQKNGYDTMARTLKATRHLNINNNDYTTGFTYNDGDKITSTIYPNSGPTITNLYFSGDSIKQVSLNGGSVNYYTVSAGAYDELGHVTNFVYGNSLSTTRSFYSVSKRLASVNAGTVFTRSFTYTAGDDILSLNGTGITNVSVTYDNLHRIKTYTGLSGSYAYDAVGNITNNIEGGAQGYSYGVRRGQAVKTIGTAKYLYDLCGNMIVRQGDTTSPQSLVYDAENHLVRFAAAGTNFMLVTFGYDADGVRLWKWNNQNPTNLQVWICNYYEEKGGKVLYHVYANGEQVCTFETNSALYGNTSDTNHVAYYYNEDNISSSCALSSGNSPAAQQEVDTYYPFGRTAVANPQANFQVSRRFTGQILDAETGLYYYGSRYYDPQLGRFIQPDTIIPNLGNPQSYNRYSYCGNDPLTYNDPTGHSFEDYVLGSTGLASFVASSQADEWAKTIRLKNGSNPGFKSFADAEEYVASRKDPAGLNYDVRFARQRTQAVAVTADAAAGMANTEISIESAIVAPEARTVEITGTTRTAEQAVATTAKGGRLGNQATRDQIADIANKLEQHGWTITGGGGKLPEEYIPGPGGARKGSSYPDITATKDGKTLRVNTIDTRADGVTPTTREAKNAARIRSQKPDDTLILIPKPD